MHYYRRSVEVKCGIGGRDFNALEVDVVFPEELTEVSFCVKEGHGGLKK